MNKICVLTENVNLRSIKQTITVFEKFQKDLAGRSRLAYSLEHKKYGFFINPEDKIVFFHSQEDIDRLIARMMIDRYNKKTALKRSFNFDEQS